MTLRVCGLRLPASKPHFAVLYLAKSDERRSLETAARDLLGVAIPFARAKKLEDVVVYAYLDLAPGRLLDALTPYGVRFSRTPAGLWMQTSSSGPVHGKLVRSRTCDVQASDRRSVASARRVAEVWLSLLDKDDVKATYGMFAPYFTSTTSLDSWRRGVTSIREKGRVTKRVQLSVFERRDLREYSTRYGITFDYASRTIGGRDTLERVSLALGDDGRWRVLGYAIFLQDVEERAAAGPLGSSEVISPSPPAPPGERENSHGTARDSSTVC